MGGLGFGQGYFGQYSSSGTPPVAVPVTPDVLIQVRADVGTIQVRPDPETILVRTG